MDVDTTDPVAVWNAVLDQLAANRTLAWVKMLRLDRVDAGRAVLVPLPGKRDVAKFAQPKMLTPVAAAMNQVLGRRVELVVELPEAGQPAPQSRSAMSDAARRDAMDLPLVRRVLEVFPDANILAVDDESPEADPPDEDPAP